MDDLPLQVAEIDDIEVDDADPTDAGRRQIHRRGRTEAARADAQNAAGFEASLSVNADLGHDEMPAVALDFFVREFRKPVSHGFLFRRNVLSRATRRRPTE